MGVILLALLAASIFSAYVWQLHYAELTQDEIRLDPDDIKRNVRAIVEMQGYVFVYFWAFISLLKGELREWKLISQG